MSEYLPIKLSLIVPDPRNRKEDIDLEKLAGSISEHGLLENLVVRPFFQDFQLIAGERRWRALRLLEERGQWPTGEAMCLVVSQATDDGASILQLVENIQRLDPTPWHLGRRFIELCESGQGQREIAAAIGKSASFVSRHAQIAAGLAPSIVRRLDKLGPRCLTDAELLSVSKLVDEMTGAPDESAQLSEVQRLLSGERKRKVIRPSGMLPLRERVFLRYERLAKNRINIPRKIRPVVELLVAYLEGRVKTLDTKVEEDA